MPVSRSKSEWDSYIAALRRDVVLDTKTPYNDLVGRVADVLENAVLDRAEEALKKGSIGLLFSGGIDSTLIGHILFQHDIPFTAVSVGFRDNPSQKIPDDLIASQKVARGLGFEYMERVYDFDMVEKLFRETASVLSGSLLNTVNLGVGSVESAGVHELKSSDPSIVTIFSGLGGEEIFAGYERHAKSEDVVRECWRGLQLMFDRDLLREFAIADYHGISLETPFLERDVVALAMRVPGSYKLSSGRSKVILRDAAQHLDLDVDFSQRPKKAAQYGSRTHHALSKLASKNGCSYINDYLQLLRDTS